MVEYFQEEVRRERGLETEAALRRRLQRAAAERDAVSRRSDPPDDPRAHIWDEDFDDD